MATSDTAGATWLSYEIFSDPVFWCDWSKKKHLKFSSGPSDEAKIIHVEKADRQKIVVWTDSVTF